LQTPERFVSLASLLAPPVPARDEIPFEIVEGAAANDNACAAEDEVAAEERESEFEAARAARLFCARIGEAVEGAVETLLEDIASEVLARELRLAPADIDAIVSRVLQRFIAEEPVRVRVHPDEAALVRCAVPVAADAALKRGDAVLDLRSGSVEASLGVRLESVLRA